MYFSFFGSIAYDSQYLVDLSKKINDVMLDDPKYLYDTYFIQDGERPDSVSNKFYDVPYYHWVILVTNGLTLKTWPKSDKVLSREWEMRYGGLPVGTHHYETTDGIIVPYSFPKTITLDTGEVIDHYFNGDGLGKVQDNTVYLLGEPVLEYDHEIALNDAKKQIRILDKRFIPDFVNLARELLETNARTVQ